jgi:hypothetical protein
MSATSSEIIIYKTADGKTKINVRLENNTVWLTQSQLVELYNSSKSNISEHIKHIFEEGELNQNSTVRKFRTLATNGKNYEMTYYNLEMIIALGYRIKSPIATNFRIWATERITEYLTKGFTINDEFLKQLGGGQYRKQLLDTIRDIRSSEKVLYRQVLDLYATSIDYNPRALESINFFKIVQNKLHFATHLQTASEVIYNRADADKDFMGLTTFRGDLPVLDEVRIAKNYLSKEELEHLNRLVSAFFDLAELRAMQHQPMKMQDWIKELEDLLRKYGKGVLTNAGTISHEEAMKKAEKEYRKFQVKTLSEVEKAYLDSLKKIEEDLTN